MHVHYVEYIILYSIMSQFVYQSTAGAHLDNIQFSLLQMMLL